MQGLLQGLYIPVMVNLPLRLIKIKELCSDWLAVLAGQYCRVGKLFITSVGVSLVQLLHYE